MVEDFVAAIDDVVAGLRLAPLWLSLGWEQTLARFRRTLIGPFWLSANLLAISFALAFVFSGLWGASFKVLFPSMIAGILVWTIIGGAIGEAAGVFISSAGAMQSQKLPLSFHVFLLLHKAFINFVAQLLTLWAVFAVMRIGGFPAWPLLIGLPLVLATSFFLCLIVAVPSTRFRDVNQLVGFLIQIAFFVTPVFWLPTQAKGPYRALLIYNPLAHLLEMVRQPLMGHTPSAIHYEWAFGTLIISAVVAILMLALYRRRIVFWL